MRASLTIALAHAVLWSATRPAGSQEILPFRQPPSASVAKSAGAGASGYGGGAVLGDRLVTGKHGLAGSAGQARFGPLPDAERIEDQASGIWIASAAKEAGHDIDARGVIAASHAGEAWAEAIVARAAEHIGLLILNLHMLYDPTVFVIGGGIGLADGMLERFERRVTALPSDLRPMLSHAALGKYAGAIGAADLAMAKFNQQGGN